MPTSPNRRPTSGRLLAVLALLAILVGPHALPIETTPAAFAAPPPPGRSAIKRFELFNTPVSSQANIITATTTTVRDTTSVPTASFRLTVGLADDGTGVDSVLELRVTDSDGNAVDLDFNSGTALDAGKLYTFVFGASSTYYYNFQCETATTIGYMLLEEIQDGSN